MRLRETARPRTAPTGRLLQKIAVAAVLLSLLSVGPLSCRNQQSKTVPTLKWYVFNEPSGAFVEAARVCSESSGGRYRIEMTALPTDADQQREQLVRRLAAQDSDIDIIGMDVIWTPEFAEAGWILPWRGKEREGALAGRLRATVASATYDGVLWAAPLTTNTQLLWYRTDRVKTPPKTWDEMIGMAEALGEKGTIQAQGERYEGLTVFFTSLEASAGGRILTSDGKEVALPEGPTRKALAVMERLANSPAADPSLNTAREDQARLAFEAGNSSFMVNYTFVWPSARSNAPEVARHMGWSRWPAVDPQLPSRVTIGGINLGVAAYSDHPDLAFEAATCLASEENQRLAATKGGLPPTIEALYNDPAVRQTFPFADLLRETLSDAVQRPQTPVYSDISYAISRTLHPMKDIDPQRDVEQLRHIIDRALHSEGLL